MNKSVWKPARAGWICFWLSLITLAIFLPALSHDFLVYDDQQYVTENPHVQAGLTWQGAAWAFRSFYASNWHPLTWLSHMLDCQLYDLNAAGHHLTSVLLHVANSVLLFMLLNRLTGALWRSAFVAVLFAWHPLHVESVAWIAERKDVLSAFFWLLTILAYEKYVSIVRCCGSKEGTGLEKGLGPRSRITFHVSRITHHASIFYLLSVLCFALGLMSKPMVVTLPFVLLLLDYWPLKRFVSSGSFARLLLEKLPFFGLTVVGCALTFAAQGKAHSIVSTAGLSIPQRVGHALLSYAHYLAATFLPRNLAVYYPYRSDLSVLEVIGAAGLLAIISGLVLGFAKRRPWLLVGWLWYLGTLVPVIGLVQVGDQAWADRYTYLPLIGLFVAIVWGLAELPSSARVPFLAAPIVAVSLTLIISSSFQLRYWKNSQTLFAHAAQVTRNNHMAITLLGSLLAKEGKLDEAMEHYRTALRYQPNYPEAHFFLGNALDLKGDLEGAIAEYRQALWFKPTQEQTHLFLAAALAKQAKTDEAITHYLAALKLNPESAIAHQNLARLLQTEGRLDEAIDHYFSAIRLAPSLAQAHNNLGVLLLQTGRVAEGTVQLGEALRLNPGNVESEYNLALALNQQGRWAEAARVLAPLVGTKLDDPDAHYQLGLALAHDGKTREAMSHFARALLLNADFPQALNQLAWILATDARPEFRNGMQALGMAQRACELTQQGQAPYLATLAAACAEAGQFNEAIQAAQKARALATAKQQKELVTECDAMIAAFQLKRPWREQMSQGER